MTPTDLVVSPRGLRFLGRTFPCSLGRGGLSHRKAEGDGATPVGTHRLVGMLYRPDRMTRPAGWALPIRPFDIWSDDPRDPDYNMMGRRPSPWSHERLARPDPLYDLVILTDWNWPYAVKGRGSAIFMHRWRKPGHPTEGCVALAPEHLAWIAPRIRYSTRLIVKG
ncbi:MAG: L,D-transpeptidase family protein [Pseudomonadota bacterium]